MVSYVPLPLHTNELDHLVSDAKDFVCGHGVIIRSQKDPTSADAVVHAPFTLIPSPLLRSCFHQALSVHTDFSLLMHHVARHPEFLLECLGSVIEVDEFTRRLWNICDTVHKEGPAQHITLSLSRSDYMIGTENDTVNTETAKDENLAHSMNVSLKQVEFNTISASFAGLGQNVSSYHRAQLVQIVGKYSLEQIKLGSSKCNVPENQAVDGLAEGLVKAWKLYGNRSAVILFLVYELERNIYDHRFLEYAIYDINSEIKVIRRTLKDVTARAYLSDDKRLMIDNMEVSIVYMRCCYKPSDYDGDRDWAARLMMERSRAIICPTSAYQLAGTKKVQQVLAAPGVVERFIKDPAAVSRIRSTFADQFSLDLNEEGEKNTLLGIEKPHLFVLKPQREGGGNNTYGEDVRTELVKMRHSPERSSFILMRRIHPVIVKNYPVAPEKPVELKNMVNELGTYGTLIANGDEVVFNKQQGYLLRTKPVGTDEGGVATGYSVLDSPYLVDTWPPTYSKTDLLSNSCGSGE